MRKTCLALVLPLALCALQPSHARVEPPGLALADPYHSAMNPARYLVSEKLDGARAYWDGRRLVSRGGTVYHAPDWFIEGLPDVPLDGELWMGRGTFESLMRTIRDREPDDDAWRDVGYHVFDLPASRHRALQRQAELMVEVERAGVPHLHYVMQRRLTDRSALQQALDDVVAVGGEGLMLQHVDALYQRGRHAGLLKVTPHSDAEALVVGYSPGRGKYTGLVGALIVETPEGVRFKLGSGLRDAERAAPPAIGERVTYRYTGYTQRGVPRFARYLRRRPVE